MKKAPVSPPEPDLSGGGAYASALSLISSPVS